ncbi:oxidoreductase [Paraneptunicella aestuarii]|uniref:acrylyl-CoA reductase (NADPH) n=1 Tax=Paraneptunicella aestuarii TaxID=2831148 RepID=UPI001E55B174|nr:MDR family oxidoreductase [Paraneptunicella aestuarii]UAA37721.1 oxidoreductase [Paraneptunicella aestuarii]
MYKSLLVDKNEQGYQTLLTELSDDFLTEGDVLVDVAFSTINYKDALAITGKAPVVRQFPLVPGIDFAGTVAQSAHAHFKAGDKVLLNGFGVGEKHHGGLAQKARVNGDWLIPLPAAISAEQAMVIGTAGYTAMLCVIALEKHNIKPESGDVLVTGATGGVGSWAVKILSELGYRVVASTGSMAQSDYLKSLGASEIIDRAELSQPGKPLMKERWAAAIDSVGSTTLANVCASIQYGGAVAACGLAQGMDFPATVAPFILRGVSLLGVDSVMRPLQDRIEAWERLAQMDMADYIDAIATKITLHECVAKADELLKGQITGRLLVDVNA